MFTAAIALFPQKTGCLAPGPPAAAPAYCCRTPGTTRSTPAARSPSRRGSLTGCDRRLCGPGCPGEGLAASPCGPGWPSCPARAAGWNCPNSSPAPPAWPPTPPPAPSATESAPKALGSARLSHYAKAGGGRAAGASKASILAAVVTSSTRQPDPPKPTPTGGLSRYLAAVRTFNTFAAAILSLTVSGTLYPRPSSMTQWTGFLIGTRRQKTRLTNNLECMRTNSLAQCHVFYFIVWHFRHVRFSSR